jgi:hypothetical protein
MSVLSDLIEELNGNPEGALELADTLARIAGPWEEIPGGFQIKNMAGQEIAHITKNFPKWRVVINGEYAKEAPFIMHANHTLTGKNFVEEELRKLGYIVRTSEE